MGDNEGRTIFCMSTAKPRSLSESEVREKGGRKTEKREGNLSSVEFFPRRAFGVGWWGDGFGIVGIRRLRRRPGGKSAARRLIPSNPRPEGFLA